MFTGRDEAGCRAIIAVRTLRCTPRGSQTRGIGERRRPSARSRRAIASAAAERHGRRGSGFSPMQHSRSLHSEKRADLHTTPARLRYICPDGATGPMTGDRPGFIFIAVSSDQPQEGELWLLPRKLQRSPRRSRRRKSRRRRNPRRRNPRRRLRRRRPHRRKRPHRRNPAPSASPMPRS